MYNVIIIGGGPCGLYMAMRLIRKNPHGKILILEKNREYGGRTRMITFEHEKYVGGAGVIRQTDCRMRRLCRQMGIPPLSFKDPNLTILQEPPVNVCKTIHELSRRKISRQEQATTTFGDFLHDTLGKKGASRFQKCAGYTDYKKSDIVDTLKHYGWSDVMPKPFGTRTCRPDWDHLIHTMVDFLRSRGVRLKHSVECEKIRVSKDDGCVEVHTHGGVVYRGVRVILAVPAPNIQKLFPTRKIPQNLRVQPFLRSYIRVRVDPEKCLSPLGGMIYSTTPLQKIIPMRQMKNNDWIFMSSYSDNANARKVHASSNSEIEKWLKKSGYAVTSPIKKRLDVFWEIGTHYFTPLPLHYKNRSECIRDLQCLHPDRVFCVSEGLSNNQGWTEGALESVDMLLRDHADM